MEFFELLFTQIGLKDAIDILIVAFLLYQALLIVHGTRAFQMLVGVGILIALFWVGISFQLYSLNWMLSHFFDSFFIIVVILFQDQIRSALTSAGAGKRFFGFLKGEEEETEFEEIVEAAGTFSRQKIGALICIQRATGLNNYIQTGTHINAAIHSDLLISLFQTNSPLHDGAAIIQEGRIAAAGCFLPLSKSAEVEKQLGTRHRAALGLSEVTDAAVVTVSEETGRINLCYEGRFYYCENENILRQYLKMLWSLAPGREKLIPIGPIGE